MRWLAERVPTSGRYLGLWGGGADAEIARSLRPDVEIVSAEKDPKLRLALIDHARQFEFTPLPGDFRKATGRFDLIYLDLCGNASEAMMRLVHAASLMLTDDGALVVTITPDHEQDAAVSVSRPVTIGPLLVARSRMGLVGLMSYRNKDRKQIILAVLHGPARKLDVIAIDGRVRKNGRWSPYGQPVPYGRLLFQNSLLAPRRWDRVKARIANDPTYARKHREMALRSRSTPESKRWQSEYYRRYREQNKDRLSDYQRRWRAARKKGPFEKSCVTCGSQFVSPAWNSKYCGSSCNPRPERERLNAASRRWRATHLEQIRARDRERMRRKRLAAVSGTAAEAVNSEVAA